MARTPEKNFHWHNIGFFPGFFLLPVIKPVLFLFGFLFSGQAAYGDCPLVFSFTFCFPFGRFDMIGFPAMLRS